MARIRTVKPEVVKHETLFDAEEETGLPIRFAWVMLPCLCDREGRFKWKPRRMKPDLLPYDEAVDVSDVLDALLTRGLLVKYRVKNEWFGWIPTFTKHQVINNRESPSELPNPSEADEAIYEGEHELDVCVTRPARVNDAQGTPRKHAQAEGKGREGKGTDNTPPDGGEGGRKPSTPPCPHQEIIDLYHEMLPSCRRVKDWHSTRQALLRARWREDPKRQNLEWWREFFGHVAKSKFLTGRSEPRNGRPPFVADLEWLIRPTNFAKVGEGKYNDE